MKRKCFYLMSLFLIATMQLWGNNMRETGVFDPTTIIKEQPAGIIHDSMIRYDTYYFNPNRSLGFLSVVWQ